MKCDNCNRPATYNSMLVVDGQKTEVHLCTECAVKAGVLQNFGAFPLNSFFDILQPQSQQLNTTKQCSRCHTTANEFLSNGVVGCSQCYNDLREVIAPVIRQLHADGTHKPSTHAMNERQKQLLTLRAQLKKAIEEERYEDAGAINKQIKSLEAQDNE